MTSTSSAKPEPPSILEIWKQRRELREKKRAKDEICHSLDNYILPFLEGVANSFNEPLLPGIKRLITEDKNPFRPRQDWNRTQETQTAIGNFVKHPLTSRLWFIAKPILRKKVDLFNSQIDWVINEILKDEYPDIHQVITETEGGVEWFKTFISDLATALKPLTK